MTFMPRLVVPCLVMLLSICLLVPAAYAQRCDTENIQSGIACLMRLGISIDQFTDEYLQWVSDLQAKLEELNLEEARCSALRQRHEEDPTLSVLKQISLQCEGKWLEDRVHRFNRIKEDYLAVKERYQAIRRQYDIAKELLALIDERQRRLEREYGQSSRY